ncbi:flagellar FliJ protein [Thalassobacillus cyri]|uniref:Flagellar FliJ protein n=1 Tax=Thalassobacillus cyri TaxID=571932 RepID=A0A1H4G308_9BACI|nr:flagellar export protein FliJ [Thalassobacillus cyri]SEB03308.1 flagellar FliJ protein [Thalassobacillus cyri]
MASLHAFHKIRDIHENDKLTAQEAYQQAMSKFEEAAKQLYETLKKKEATEQLLHDKLANGKLSAHYFAQMQDFIARLDQRVMQLQPKVQKARSEMEHCQHKLTEAYVEVKKFDKLIDKKVEKWQVRQKEAEKRQMDELSLRQFLIKRNR